MRNSRADGLDMGFFNVEMNKARMDFVNHSLLKELFVCVHKPVATECITAVGYGMISGRLRTVLQRHFCNMCSPSD